jgi:hypothetical protein
LSAKEQHSVVEPGLIDRLRCGGIDGLPQVDTANLAADVFCQGDEFQ